MKVTIPTRPPAPPAGAPPDATNGAAWRGSRPSGRWRRLPRLVRWGLPLLAGLLVIVVVARQAAPPAATAVATPSVVSSKLIAHGVVQPVSRARVGSLGGGVLVSLNVSVGDSVEGQAELGRVRGPSDVEVLTAPFAGTVTGYLAHVGDTLLPGAGVVTVGDLTRLQVETTDIDEFLIDHIHPGDSVVLEIEALDRRQFTGRVQSVALQPQTTPAGDQQYPVTINLGGNQPELRPGMSARITLPD